jgi:hypothetical protein
MRYESKDQGEKLSCIVRRSRMLLYRDLISYPSYVSLRSVFHLIPSPNHCWSRVRASNAFYASRSCLGPTMGQAIPTDVVLSIPVVQYLQYVDLRYSHPTLNAQ